MFLIMVKFLAAIAEFRAAGDMHEVAGDEAGFFGKEIDRGLGNDIALGAKSQGVDLIEIARDAGGIGLLGGPLAEHRSPDAGGAHGVHPDAVNGVVEGHRFREGIHRALGGRVGGVDCLPDLTDQAAGVQDASARGFEGLEAMLRGPQRKSSPKKASRSPRKSAKQSQVKRKKATATFAVSPSRAVP